ncbi:hypothetical protein CHS0354_016514, partial [Potamilus streckersoni]
NKAFPHQHSAVQTIKGITYIHALKYLKDLNKWDTSKGVNHTKEFDVALLFTR